MSRIELEPGEQLFIASSDLKHCFYHIELPLLWRRYFGMGGVRAKFSTFPTIMAS